MSRDDIDMMWRVAEKLYLQNRVGTDFATESGETQAYWLHRARAILKCQLEPTPRMIEQGVRQSAQATGTPLLPETVREIWYAMMDDALV